MATIPAYVRNGRFDILAANQLGHRAHVGITATAPGFYGAQGRPIPQLPIRFPDLADEMAQQGVLIIASHNLSYAHGDNEIERVVTAYKKVLPILAEAIERNKVKELIKGRTIPAHANVRLP